jgi:hypothetical protein
MIQLAAAARRRRPPLSAAVQIMPGNFSAGLT